MPNSAPSALISVSALKLSDGRLVTRASSAIVGELCSASVSAAGGVRPIVGLAPLVDAAAPQRLLELAGGEARRVLLEVRPAQARAPAVEGQRAQRPDLAGGAVALRRPAAQRVEGRLVADHAPGDLAQALVEHEVVGELGGLERAEARVAAAAQVEVADQDAAWVDADVAQRAGGQVPVDAVERERGGGDEQLVHRGRRARRVGAQGEDLAAAVEVDRQRARAAAGVAHLRGQRGAGRRGARGLRGGGQERGCSEQHGDEAVHPSHRVVESRQPAGRREVAVAFRPPARDSQRDGLPAGTAPLPARGRVPAGIMPGQALAAPTWLTPSGSGDGRPPRWLPTSPPTRTATPSPCGSTRGGEVRPPTGRAAAPWGPPEEPRPRRPCSSADPRVTVRRTGSSSPPGSPTGGMPTAALRAPARPPASWTARRPSPASLLRGGLGR